MQRPSVAHDVGQGECESRVDVWQGLILGGCNRNEQLDQVKFQGRRIASRDYFRVVRVEVVFAFRSQGRWRGPPYVLASDAGNSQAGPNESSRSISG
jgi:hypothetical protein